MRLSYQKLLFRVSLCLLIGMTGLLGFNYRLHGQQPPPPMLDERGRAGVLQQIAAAGYGETPASLTAEARSALVFDYIFSRSGEWLGSPDSLRKVAASTSSLSSEQLGDALAEIVVDQIKSFTPEQGVALLRLVNRPTTSLQVGKGASNAVILLGDWQLTTGIITIRREMERDRAVAYLRPYAQAAVRHVGTKFAESSRSFSALTQGGTRFSGPEAIFVAYAVLSGDYAGVIRQPGNAHFATFPFQFFLTPAAIQRLCEGR